MLRVCMFVRIIFVFLFFVGVSVADVPMSFLQHSYTQCQCKPLFVVHAHRTFQIMQGFYHSLVYVSRGVPPDMARSRVKMSQKVVSSLTPCFDPYL
jgi:hypothetical protein